MDFDANDDASVADSVDSSVQDTPMFNSNLGRSKYSCTYRRTMHYDPTTGHTIGAEVKLQQLPTITNVLKKQMTV
jgi:hypothetical protein